ncbi:MAG: efflux RND transporter permease subunit [Planctomycetota bacterium]|jgi:multidrug efflux pump|nr:efflux RND transporter permease subunit [Planctomycetota bacterium]
MAKFFINRPIFAWVVAIVMMLGGAVSIYVLPVAQYPHIALPQVVINASYPGASAETLSNTVTQIIEQNMNGIDNLLYMSSATQSSGYVDVNLTFRNGVDPDIAQVQVQNKLQLAIPMLPQEVQRRGLSVRKTSASFLMVVGFISRGGDMNETDIADYVNTYVKDGLARLSGVGEIQVFGAQRSMRVWVDPLKLANFGLTIADIEAVIERQNFQVSSGQIGGMPNVSGQGMNATIIAQSQLQTVEEFEEMLIRVKPDGARLRMRDVARVELGREDYGFEGRYFDQESGGKGYSSAGVAIRLATGANALDTAGRVKEYMDAARSFFPPGLDYLFPYDTTPFVRISIREVMKTLVEAVIMVVLVLYVFLQNWRTTIIPSIAVPVVLLASFAVVLAFGFSINTMTMFGMVLAIGMLVDDAIVVVENCERLMREEKLPPKAAAERCMEQLTGALIGTAMVVVAVMLPMAFFGGSAGVIYRQFSITICTAMTLSIVVAIVLTPALCATILDARDFEKGEATTGLFGLFNRYFMATSVRAYVAIVGHMTGRWVRYALVYAILVGAMLYSFRHIPTAFLPEEDQGVMLVEIQLPAGSTLDQTLEVLGGVAEYFVNEEKDAVTSAFGVAGFSLSGMGQDSAMAFIKLREWDERQKPELRVKALQARAMKRFMFTPGLNRAGVVFPIVPPAVIELGTSGGFDAQLIDMANVGHAAVMRAKDSFLALAGQPRYARLMQNVRHKGKSDQPQYKISVDNAKAVSHGVALADIHDMLSKGWGGDYINDFLNDGRIKKVSLQAEAASRMLPEDFSKWYIRNNQGTMTPFGALFTGEWIYGSPRLERYNGLPSAEIMGDALQGVSTGEVMLACEEIVREINRTIPGVALDWTGLSLQERQAGEQTTALYAVSILAIFLFLAALYESWTIPLSILMTLPIGIMGVAAAALVFHLANDIYFQVGFLTIIGLAAKNAILIVEFARTLHEDEGMDIVRATIEACRLRLRPIWMTVLTFILGVLPLAISSGAGSGAQNTIGIGITGGMVTNTLLGIIYAPLFFVLVTRAFSWRKGKKPAAANPAGGAP